MLEMIAVIILIGLISTLGMTTLSGHIDSARLIRTSNAIANADRLEREMCRQSPIPGELKIEKRKGRMSYKNSMKNVAIADGVRISEVILGSQDSNRESVLFSQSGQSATYAVCLTTRRGAINWVVVIGLTGQVLFYNDTDKVRSLLSMGQPT